MSDDINLLKSKKSKIRFEDNINDEQENLSVNQISHRKHKKSNVKITILDPEIEKLYDPHTFQTSDGTKVVYLDKYGEKFSDRDVELLTIPVVAAMGDKSLQRKFYCKTLGILTLQMIFMFALVYLSIYYTVIPIITYEFPWLIIIIVVLLLITGIIWWTNIFEDWSIPHQIFGLILTTIIITICLSFLTAQFSTDVFLFSILLVGIIIFSLFLFSLFPQFGFSSIGLNLYTFAFVIGAGVFLIYWPYRDEWNDPKKMIIDHQQELQDNLISLIFTLVFICTLIWHMNRQQHRLRHYQYIYAAYIIYIDACLLFLTLAKGMNCRVNMTKNVNAATGGTGEALMKAATKL